MKTMNCQQFQEILPYIIESGGKPEEEQHLETCSACTELVNDLRYIAEQAKLLLPMHDPNPRVWNNIEQSLQQEGMLPEGRMSRQGHLTKTSTQAKNWTPLGWVLALAAVIIFAVVLTNYRTHQLPSTQLSAQNVSADSASNINGDDQQLITQVAQEDPAARGAYESSLREANSYIADAQQAAQQDPDDPAAQELLFEAYQQKEMLYQMANARSLP
ncbi:MAG TPA: hypothetical protein VFB76_14805 [Candidatus Angelobacter sp.]|nr:hypothetical protein [Candidatus Angelobacter sp.]